MHRIGNKRAKTRRKEGCKMNLQHSDSRRLEQYTQELLRMYQKRREVLSHLESTTADKGRLEPTMSQADQNRNSDQLIASQTEGRTANQPTTQPQTEEGMNNQSAQPQAEDNRMSNQPSQSQTEDRMNSQPAQSQTEDNRMNNQPAQSQAEDRMNSQTSQSQTEDRMNNQSAQPQTEDRLNNQSAQSQAEDRMNSQPAQPQVEDRLNSQTAQSQTEDRLNNQSAQSQAAARQNESLLNNTEETVPTLLRDDETTMPSQGQVLSESEAESDHDAAMEEFLRENPSNGFIKVQAYSGLGAFPVKGVRIRITKEIGGKEILFVNDVTDESGKTQARSLPAPNLSMSQTPGQPGALPPYSTYTLTAEKPDYITLIKRDLPIFPGVISIQPLEMLAVPKSQLTSQPIVNEEEEPNL